VTSGADPRVLPPVGTITAGHVAAGADTVVPLPELGPWRPRLVATDLDGTLLTSAGTVSPRTRAVLDACRDAGVPVVGATGRGPRLLDSVRTVLDGRGVAVLAQGGYVVDLERDVVLRTVGLPRDRATAVVEAIERAVGPVLLAVEEAAEQGEARRPLRLQHGFDWPYPEPTDLLPRDGVLPPGPVLKVFVRSAALGQDELLARARQAVDPAEAELTHAGLGFIEVLPPGVTKATGLAVALEHHGVALADVVVFGDMPNDLPMLGAVRAAGGRSVAVANAHPDVRAAAEHLTSGDDADGVARYLEALVLEGGPRV
jgi:Cof subfamily protein (haloacid dehalogenase superfamily)